MSHGGGSGDVGEPNLTPLLDLVLQLLMFFLIVANFVMEQNNQDIKLPEATTAVPIEKDEGEFLALNIDLDGALVLSETDKRTSDVQIAGYLRDQFAFFSRRLDGKTDKLDKLAVVVRGDNRANFEFIYRVMRAAKEAGFKNVQLRANKHAVGG